MKDRSDTGIACLGLHVTRPLAIPDTDLAYALVLRGYLTDAEEEDREKIDAGLEAWVTKMADRS